ncbi:MAG: ribonuclease E/G [Dongiaceae bacterium]
MAREPVNRLVVATRGSRQWIAWLAGGRLVELHVQSPDFKDDVGSIYLGRVARVDKNLAAAFIDLGVGKSGMLPLDSDKEKISEGSAITVQVARNEQSEKGPRLSGGPSIAGGVLVLTPGGRGISLSDRIVDKHKRRLLAAALAKLAKPGEGLMARTAASDVADDDLASELERLRRQWQQVLAAQNTAAIPSLLMQGPGTLRRLIRDSGAAFAEIEFDARNAATEATEWCQVHAPRLAARIGHCRPQDWKMPFDEIIEQARIAVDRQAPLPSGGRLLFEPGETLTAIDVDSGRHATSSGDSGAEQVFLKTNLEAVEEICRQLRLRKIGGVIVIDFINMSNPANRRRVVERLRTAMATDPARCWVGSMSRLGLVEMTRRRLGPTLAEMMTDVCPTCEGLGRTTRATWPLMQGAVE